MVGIKKEDFERLREKYKERELEGYFYYPRHFGKSTMEMNKMEEEMTEIKCIKTNEDGFRTYEYRGFRVTPKVYLNLCSDGSGIIGAVYPEGGLCSVFTIDETNSGIFFYKFQKKVDEWLDGRLNKKISYIDLCTLISLGKQPKKIKVTQKGPGMQTYFIFEWKTNGFNNYWLTHCYNAFGFDEEDGIEDIFSLEQLICESDKYVIEIEDKDA